MAGFSGDGDIELEIEVDDGEGQQSLLQSLRNTKAMTAEKPSGLFEKDQIDTLFKDWDVQLPYSCKLTLDDITLDESKADTKTYQIQILKKDDIYGLFCRWTNAGGKSDYSINKTQSFDEVVGFFKQKFYEKTFNNWEQREIFKIKPGAYKLIGNYRANEPAAMDIEIDGERKKTKDKIKLMMLRARTQSTEQNRSVFLTVMNLLDLDESESLMDQFSINKTRLGLADLEIKNLLRCHKILAEIEYQLFSSSRKNQKIFELSAEFSSVIPQNYKMAQNQMIDDLTKLRRAYHLVSLLMGICHQVSLFKNLEFNELTKGQPLDQIYNIMGCQLRPVQQTNNEISDNIKKLMTAHSSHHQSMKLVLKDLFEVHREGDTQNYFPFRQLKRRLLWLGAPIPKIAEYLSKGINLVKTESASSAGFFGKAIYLTDVVSKAAKHCGIDVTSKIGFLLLYDVAVGKEFVTDRSKIYPRPPKGYHSIKGQGKYECADSISIENAVGSVGEPVKVDTASDSTFMHNEFAVFDEHQLRPVYLVRVEFNY